MRSAVFLIAFVLIAVLTVISFLLLRSPQGVSLKIKIVGFAFKIRLSVRERIMKKYRWLVQFVVDIFIFWLVFEWNDSVIIGAIKSCLHLGASYLKTWLISGWDILYEWSPYGRDIAQDPKFRFALNACTICALLGTGAIIGLVSATKKRLWILKGLAIVLTFFAMWYVLYTICFLIVEITVCYFALAILAAIVASCIVSFVFLLIWCAILDYLDELD